MKRMKTPFQRIASPRNFKARVAAALAACMIAAACVTVNVNFPESAVQKATDDYVRDLYRAKEKGKSPTSSASPEPIQPAPSSSNPSPLKASFFHFDFSLIPSAYAVDAKDYEFKVNTPKTEQIRSRQAERLSELADKASGQWGEGNDGYLALKAGDDLKKKDLLLKRVQKLIDSENADRKELYNEVLKTNSLPPARLIDIQKKFANSFRDAAPKGTWIQADDGSWKKK